MRAGRYCFLEIRLFVVVEFISFQLLLTDTAVLLDGTFTVIFHDAF